MKDRVKKFMKDHQTEILIGTHAILLGMIAGATYRNVQLARMVGGFKVSEAFIGDTSNGMLTIGVKFRNGLADVARFVELDANGQRVA